MQNRNRAWPSYEDSNFELLVEAAAICADVHLDCEVCPALRDCRKQWDLVCGRFVDKSLNNSDVLFALIRLRIAAPVFGRCD